MRHQSHRGFTLIEVMIATMLCMVLSGIATMAFIQADRAISRHKVTQTLHAEAAHAYMRLLQVCAATASYKQSSGSATYIGFATKNQLVSWYSRPPSRTDNTRSLGLDDLGEWARWELTYDAAAGRLYLARCGSIWSAGKRQPISPQLVQPEELFELRANRSLMLTPDIKVLLLTQAKKAALYGGVASDYQDDQIAVFRENNGKAVPVSDESNESDESVEIQAQPCWIRLFITLTNDLQATNDHDVDFYSERQGFVYRSFTFAIPLYQGN